MKNVIVFLLVFFAVVVVAIQACDKIDNESSAPNQPPVAKAGNDIYLSLTRFDPKVNISLDGRTSYDPEHYPYLFMEASNWPSTGYRWILLHHGDPLAAMHSQL